MKIITKLNKWTNRHNPYYLLDILRWVFGSYLFFKGVTFMTNTQYLKDIIAPESEFAGTMFIVHYVSMAHLAGGVLIVLGLMTRLALLIQIPILIGAVAVNFIVAMNPPNLIEASLALLFALFYMVVGSGKHSADYRLKLQM